MVELKHNETALPLTTPDNVFIKWGDGEMRTLKFYVPPSVNVVPQKDMTAWELWEILELLEMYRGGYYQGIKKKLDKLTPEVKRHLVITENK